MITGFFIGILVAIVGFVVMSPCPHSETEYVSKCIRCGKVFDDGLSRLRERMK
jgi:hypothetical protein